MAGEETMKLKPNKVQNFALITFCAWSVVLFSQDLTKDLEALMGHYAETEIFNGAALVSKEGKVIYQKGHGWANMEWELPNTADTKFRLGSITKQFTAMLIMQLVQEGKLKLEDKITDCLPDYPAKNGNRITIHHLLSHTSGIPNYTAQPDFKMRDPHSVEDFIATFSEKDLEFEPGAQFRYSNSGYFVLGAVIEAKTNLSYEAALKKYILDPVGMKNTGYDHHDTLLPKRAAGYERKLDRYVNAPYLDMSLPYAAGSMFSTVGDLFLWDRALETQTLLSEDLKKIMFTPVLNNFAYGWILQERKVGDETVKTVFHGGGINGFNTLIVRFPHEGHLVVLLNNTGGTDLNGIAGGIAELLFGQPYKKPKTAVTAALRKGLSESQLDQVIDAIKTNRDHYDIRERSINSFGYQLLGADRVDEAISVFKLNVALFPGSSNPYDSLGEAYKVKGQKVPAIVNYQKSLELDPTNANAVTMLAELGVKAEVSQPEEQQVDAKLLERYVGQYELTPQFAITVTLEGSQLHVQATGQPRFPVFAKSEHRFFLKVVKAEVEFKLGDGQKAESLTLYQGGMEKTGLRVE